MMPMQLQMQFSKNTYRRSSDWQFASEGCVHVKSAELLSDLSELRVDAAKTGEN